MATNLHRRRSHRQYTESTSGERLPTGAPSSRSRQDLSGVIRFGHDHCTRASLAVPEKLRIRHPPFFARDRRCYEISQQNRSLRMVQFRKTQICLTGLALTRLRLPSLLIAAASCAAVKTQVSSGGSPFDGRTTSRPIGASIRKYCKFFPCGGSASSMKRIPSFSSTRLEAVFPAMITAITLSSR
jgi:hypothetical protein